MVEYKIIQKEQFTVMGKSGMFNLAASHIEIPKFWKAHHDAGGRETVCGMFGICINHGEKCLNSLLQILISRGKWCRRGMSPV